MKIHADLLLTALLFLLVACDKQAESARKGSLSGPETVVDGSNKTLTGAEIDLPGEWRAYEKAIESQLAELESKMKSFKTETQKAGTNAKLELKEAMNELEGKIAAARKQLEEFKSEGARTWEEMRTKMDNAMKNLEDSFDRAVARFNNSGEPRQATDIHGSS